jgi:spore coat polysaccharide biosynthesis protein SpsF
MIGCIIQARMGSTRLLGKVMELLDGKNPSLYYTINQLKNSLNVDKIIVATTKLNEDDIIEKISKNNKINCFRGNSENVLERFYECAKKFQLETIVRITADCPLIDPKIVDSFIEIFNSGEYDYVHNMEPRTFPDGLDAEVFSFKILEEAYKNAKLPSEKEHVTPYFRNNKDKFRIKNVINKKNMSSYRWTLDYQEDLDLIRNIIKEIKNRPILMNDIISLFNKKPNIFEINKKYLANEGLTRSLEEDKKFLNLK